MSTFSTFDSTSDFTSTSVPVSVSLTSNSNPAIETSQTSQQTSTCAKKFCYLDIDVNDSRNAYKRACQFVESNNLKYGLSSNNIRNLGGREMKSLKELYTNDFEWSQKGSIRIRPQPHCRLIVELYFEHSPLACENFYHLCLGDKGKSKGGGANLSLHYRGSKIHRYIPNFIMQGGDIIFGNGSGGESIWNKKFKDDSKGLKLKHNDIGILSMGNSGKNSNTSQFFITLSTAGAPQCDKKHVIFGKIIHGVDTLTFIETIHHANLATSSPEGRGGGGNESESGENSSSSNSINGNSNGEAPSIPLYIMECGEWKLGMPVDGHYGPDDTFHAH